MLLRFKIRQNMENNNKLKLIRYKIQNEKIVRKICFEARFNCIQLHFQKYRE